MIGEPLEERSLALRVLMHDDAHREVECQPYLKYAHSLLAPVMSNVVQHVREQIAMAGRCDYFMICEVAAVETRRKLVLWEVKAPQLSAFQWSTQNRLMPTKALVEAENQLLYYFDEYRSNNQFLDRYNIRHPDDVKLGGIIIGRDDNFVKVPAGNKVDQQVLRQMGASALRIRDEHFYREKIRLHTWDQIARFVDVLP